MHAVALRLSGHGYPSAVIAVAVGIDDDQVGTFLEVANAKFENVLARRRGDESSSSREAVG
jgi:hypothetical protein